jgi:hypothetical protein
MPHKKSRVVNIIMYLKDKSMVGVLFAKDSLGPFVCVLEELHEAVRQPLERVRPERRLADEHSEPELQAHAPEHRVPVDLQVKSCQVKSSQVNTALI